MRLWYYDSEESDLIRQFPEDVAIGQVNAILAKTVVERPQDCLPSATELLVEVDRASPRWTMDRDRKSEHSNAVSLL